MSDTTMRVQACLSEDSTSASLNTAAHAAEHCAVDPASLELIDSALGHQLLIRESSGRLALYTVTESISAPAQTVHVGTKGLARLIDPSAPGPRGRDATIETDFTGGDAHAPARLTEELLGDDATGLAILAPHGGRIEFGTDDQARSVYEALARRAKPIRAWIARGFNSATGAHTCWHITSSEISERSFPQLGSFFGPMGSGRRYSHAVAFHGHDDSNVVAVGGGRPRDAVHTALKRTLRSAIRAALEAVMPDPPEVEVRLTGPLSGTLRRNIVNRVATRGNGIQIEQPPRVREDAEPREAIARAVAQFYSDLV